MRKRSWEFVLRTSQDLKKDVLYLAKKNNCTIQDMLYYLILSGINNFMKDDIELREKETQKILEKEMVNQKNG